MNPCAGQLRLCQTTKCLACLFDLICSLDCWCCVAFTLRRESVSSVICYPQHMNKEHKHLWSRKIFRTDGRFRSQLSTSANIYSVGNVPWWDSIPGRVDEAHCCDTSRSLWILIGQHSKATASCGCKPALVSKTLYRMDVIQFSYQNWKYVCLTHYFWDCRLRTEYWIHTLENLKSYEWSWTATERTETRHRITTAAHTAGEGWSFRLHSDPIEICSLQPDTLELERNLKRLFRAAQLLPFHLPYPPCATQNITHRHK